MSYQKSTTDKIHKQLIQLLEDMSGQPPAPNSTGEIKVQPDGYFPDTAASVYRRLKKKKQNEKMDS